jgi:HSP20 family protein
MHITRWDPFRELEDLSMRLNRLFGESRVPRDQDTGKDALTAFDWAPSVDIAETPTEFQIHAELPDVKKDEVKVSIDDHVLRISGQRRQDNEQKDKKYHRVERSYGSFVRTFSLPDNVDGARVKADFKDGVLSVSLPKTDKPKPKSIEVKVS